MDENGFNSIVFSPIEESTALDESDIHDVVVPVARGASAIEDAAKYIREKNFNRIAINTSNQNKLADGLSHSQYLALTEYVGDEIARTFTTSEQLVYEWLSVKLPAEVEIMRKAAELTAAWQLEAYATIQPGITTMLM